MIGSINIGMIVKCLKCKKPLEISADTMKVTPEAEYVICPSCNACFDIQYYHILGERLDVNEEEA